MERGAPVRLFSCVLCVDTKGVHGVARELQEVLKEERAAFVHSFIHGSLSQTFLLLLRGP